MVYELEARRQLIYNVEKALFIAGYVPDNLVKMDGEYWYIDEVVNKRYWMGSTLREVLESINIPTVEVEQ